MGGALKHHSEKNCSVRGVRHRSNRDAPMTGGIAGIDALFSWGGMIVLSIPLAYIFAILSRKYPSVVSTFVEKAFGVMQAHSSDGFLLDRQLP